MHFIRIYVCHIRYEEMPSLALMQYLKLGITTKFKHVVSIVLMILQMLSISKQLLSQNLKLINIILPTYLRNIYFFLHYG